MNKLIDSYDLGENNIAEYCQKVDINILVSKANKHVKQQLLKSEFEILGLKVELQTSQTRFKGKRIWFVCPNCRKRIGVMYRNLLNQVGCRKCLNIRYAKQRYKGMIEEKKI